MAVDKEVTPAVLHGFWEEDRPMAAEKVTPAVLHELLFYSFSGFQ
jgi:hypothetical protein